MDFKQLKTFVVLASTLNYQTASRQLHYAPSTLYNHMQAIPGAKRLPWVAARLIQAIIFYFALQEQDISGLHADYLYQEPIRFICAGSHPLAGKRGLHYKQLDGAEFSFPHDDCLYVREMLDRLRRNSVDIGKTSYVGGVQLVLEQVMGHGDIALMPVSAVRRMQETHDVVELEFAEPPLWVWESAL